MKGRVYVAFKHLKKKKKKDANKVFKTASGFK